jgi:transcriptional regulator of arginine metabolism
MASKDDRHRRIVKLVEERAVRSQAELRVALARDGLEVEQSTLSRDLQELGVRKVGGRYVRERVTSAPVGSDPSPGVRAILPCGPTLIVIRTDPGQAPPVGVVIDAANDPAIAGTLAGDDTVFVATRDLRRQAVALRRLTAWFGDKVEE